MADELQHVCVADRRLLLFLQKFLANVVENFGLFLHIHESFLDQIENPGLDLDLIVGKISNQASERRSVIS